MRDIIIDLQKSGTWKIQLIMAINFISSTYINEEQVVHSKSNNIEVMTYKNAIEFLNRFFQDTKLIYKHQWKGSIYFWFGQLLQIYYKCQKINFERGKSYIESPDRIKNKKATINPKIKDDKCFQNEGTGCIKLWRH